MCIISLVGGTEGTTLAPGRGDVCMSTARELRDVQILNLIMRGMKVRQIARHLGLHRNTIGKTLRKPETLQLLESMKKDIAQQTTRYMIEKHKMIEQAIEGEHMQKGIRRRGHRPEDGYGPVRRFLAHASGAQA